MILDCAYETVALADQNERLIEYAESNMHFLIDYVDEFLQLGYCLANEYLDFFNETFYLREHELKMYHETYVFTDTGNVTVNGTTDDGMFTYELDGNGIDFHGADPAFMMYDEGGGFITELTAGRESKLRLPGAGGDITLTGYSPCVLVNGPECQLAIDSADITVSEPYPWPGGYESLRRLLEALVSATGVSSDS